MILDSEQHSTQLSVNQLKARIFELEAERAKAAKAAERNPLNMQANSMWHFCDEKIKLFKARLAD